MRKRNSADAEAGIAADTVHRAVELVLYAVGPLVIFLTAPILARGLGPAARGEFGVAQAVASFAVAIGALGQAEVLLAQRRTGAGDFRAGRRIATVGGVTAAVLAAVAMACLGVNIFVAVIAALFVPLLSQSQLWRSVAVVQGNIARPALNNALSSALRGIALLVLFLIGSLTVASAIGTVQFVAAVAAVLTLGLYAGRAHGDPIRNSQDKDRYRRLLLAGSPLLLFNLFTSITLRSDLIVLQVFASPVQIGVYAAASALSVSVLAVSGAFKTRVQAAMYRPSPRRRVHVEMRIVVAVAVAGAFTGVLLSPVLVGVLLGPDYSAGVSTLRILSVAAGALLILDVVHGSLVVLGLRKQLVAVAACGATVTLVSLLVLVPPMQADGAAIASAISYATAAAVGWIIVERKMRSAQFDTSNEIENATLGAPDE